MSSHLGRGCLSPPPFGWHWFRVPSFKFVSTVNWRRGRTLHMKGRGREGNTTTQTEEERREHHKEAGERTPPMKGRVEKQHHPKEEESSTTQNERGWREACTQKGRGKKVPPPKKRRSNAAPLHKVRGKQHRLQGGRTQLPLVGLTSLLFVGGGAFPPLLL